MMATYGKKKKSILPSFSVLRDSASSTSKSKKDKNKKRGTSTLRSSEVPDHTTSRYDDSIEEMASMLLDDTDIDPPPLAEPGKRLSYIPASNILSGTSHFSSQNSRTLPQLPQLLFNGDDAWAMRTVPVVTAAGSSNEVHFSFDDDIVPANRTSCIPKPVKQSGKDAMPPIPRRSSKRNSGRPKAFSTQPGGLGHTQLISTKTTDRISISPLKPAQKAGPSTIDAGADVNDKIEAMIAATKALKPSSDNTLLQGPYVPIKKRRMKDNKVLAKVKTVFNDHLQARNDRKRHDSLRDEHLLGNSSSYDTPMTDDGYIPSPALSVVSEVERRLNEGDNLKNPKVFTLTGHGNVRRKQVADDGKSLRSRKSISDDPFSERPNSSGNTRTPTSFENRLQDEMSTDQPTDDIPDLPNQNHVSDELPQRQSKKARQSSLMYDADFDALFSSSPQGQSTPRIRLEPTFEEDGKTTLKNVPADSRSLFDPDSLSIGNYLDIDVDTYTSRGHFRQGSGTKRKSVQGRDSVVQVRSPSSKRWKKHPSPSKAELERFERILSQYPDGQPEDLSSLEDTSMTGVESESVGVLTTRDTNIKLPEPTQRAKVKSFGMFLKPDLTRAAASMPDIAKRGKVAAPTLSKIPKLGEGLSTRTRLEAREERRFSTRDVMGDGSFMDTDELQWDQTALMGKV